MKPDLLKAEQTVRAEIFKLAGDINEALSNDSIFWGKVGKNLTKLAAKALIIEDWKVKEEKNV